MKHRLKYLILCIFLSTTGFISLAQSPIIFDSDNTQKYIGKQVSVFQDSTGTLNFEEVAQKPDLFKKSQNDVPNLGITESNNWVRFNVKNQSSSDKIIINLAAPSIDKATLYVLHANNKVDSSSVYINTPIKNRTYKHQFLLFDAALQPSEEVVCFLKIKSYKQILAPITLENPQSILNEISKTDTLAGIYFGIMLAMLLYNLFIYFSVRDSSYLVYVNYIFWVTLTQAALLGYSNRFSWGESIWLSPYLITISGALVGIATGSFSKSFLRTTTYLPKINLFINLIIGADVLAIILIIAGFPIISYNIVNAAAALGSIIILFAAYKVTLKNYKPAKFFLIAWSVFLLSVVLFVLKDYGILPYNFITVHSLQLGSAIEVFLLSIALADRINILKKEKEISQAEALHAANENARIIREQNIILEAKVQERTVELSVTNVELHNAMIDLKEAEAHLIESEKMASLGLLTAGIAHEINNPINFVTSNIKPLRRDVDQLLESINWLQEICCSDLSIEQKQQQIEEHKDEIDFDYLKLEIDQLLNGIKEGASRTEEIVKGLRVFSRLDEDDLKKADMNEGLNSTLTIVNNLLTNKITLQKVYGEIPLIECYPGKLNQVFLNIITNAIFAVKQKFKEEPGGNIIITSNYRDNRVFIKIQDNGTGMDEKTRKKIFEPFFTTKDVGEGTGLGMSIAYNTIRKHHGEISVNSTPGVGSEFIIELPLNLE
ncbi:sensor histidine kinase [Daejeonella oryzae]|uniref:sensor histidine kinase n=1 Tax=Daejeonella oryzae TaxID=1122943 RepID=UPI0004160FAF|nr:7TM diverse intracellular signaling domain-containing protein [Daejeonella oryzae]